MGNTLENLDKIRDIVSNRENQYRFIGGHFPFRLEEWSEISCRFITLLRNPVDQVISKYYKVLRTERKPLHTKFNSDEVGLEQAIFLLGDNPQTRQLSGCPPGIACNTTHLTAAKRTLSDDRVNVGILERFDESLIVFRYQFGWPMPLYARRNARKKDENLSLSSSIQREIKEFNALDVELYRFACSQLQERIDRLNSVDFSLYLNRFTRRLKFWSTLRLHKIESVFRRSLKVLRTSS